MNKLKITGNLINELKDIFKEKLVSVILYGSCAEDKCENEFSDINLIIVIDNLLAMDLKKATLLLKDLIKVNNSIPLFMDKDEWFNSCDSYPIEYFDIKDRYRILYGDDIVKPLVLDKKNLRLQCEHEVKNLLIRLRQGYLANSNNFKAIEALLKASSKSFFALFRAALRLTEDKVSFDHKATIDYLAGKVNIDKGTFLTLLDFRANPKVIKKDEYDITIQKLIDSTNEVLKYIDKVYG